MTNKRINCIVIFGLLLFITSGSIADDKAGEEINWQVISSGGKIDGISTNFRSSGTVAQTATGNGTSENYGLGHGFWQDFEAGQSEEVDCGDANGTSTINLLDITYLIAYLYKEGSAPIPHECVGDVNGNASLNLLDITYLIAYLYKEGPLPVIDCCNPIW